MLARDDVVDDNDNDPIMCVKSSSAIAERSRCRMGQFWPKVEDDIMQTL